MINLTKTIDEIMRARLNINKWLSSIIILQKKRKPTDDRRLKKQSQKT